MSSPNAVGYLSAARYGKDLVRVARVVREGDVHHVVEYTVRIMVEGEIETSYTEADNKCVVTTDTMKNTVYIFAKSSPHVLNPPLFALHLGVHMVTKYPHLHKSFVDVLTHKWSRIPVNGKPHGWAFLRDGEEKGVIHVEVDGTQGKDSLTGKVTVGLKDLIVLKTAGSAFENFYTDENTTLQDNADRLFSTSVTVDYSVPLPKSIPLTIDNLGKIGEKVGFEKIYETCRDVTLSTFATDNSASVQATMYNTAQNLLEEAPGIQDVSYAYPNKHFIPVNLSPFGLENGLTPKGGSDVFHPVADPSGFITATVTRK